MLNYMRRYARGTTIKILFWVIIAVFIFWGVGTFTTGDTLYVASVNGASITPNEVRQATRRLESTYRRLYGENFTPQIAQALDLKNKALQELIDMTLLEQEAERLGFSVTDEEIRTTIQGFQDLTVDGRFQREVYFRFLRMQGITPTDFEAQVRDQLLVQKVQELVTSSIRPDETGARELFAFGNEKVDLYFLRVKAADLAKDIVPSDADVAQYYDQHRDLFREPERAAIDYVAYGEKAFETASEVPDADVEQEYEAHKSDRYGDPEEVHARHILLLTPQGIDAKKRDEIRARADAVLARLEKGEDFAAVAKEVSDDKANKDKGGDLGFIRRGRAEENFENAAFGLQAAELSGVVETRRGLHIIKVDERRAAREKPLTEVRDEITKTLRTERAQNAARSAVFSDSEKAAAGQSLQDLAKARGMAVESPTPFAEHEGIAGFPQQPDLLKSVFATPSGQIGPVTQAGDVLILFRVKEKIAAHVPELKEVRAKVESALVGELATKQAEERAAEIRKTLADKKSIDVVAAEAKLKVEETGPFTRAGDYVPRIGSVPEMKKQAFALTAEAAVAPRVYVASGDAFVVVLKDHQKADMAEFDQKKTDLVKRHLDEERRAAIESLLNQLKRRAKIPPINSTAMASI